MRWHRREEDIKIALKEIEWEGMDLINLAQDRDKWRDAANVVMKLLVL
jgi:hypothetical protein